jgi:CHAT domain-containing protein
VSLNSRCPTGVQTKIYKHCCRDIRSDGMGFKLVVCLLVCLLGQIPLSSASSESWSYGIERISATALTEDGTVVLAGTSSGFYCLFDEYGEVIYQEELDTEITDVDLDKTSMILGTKTGTLILTFSGEKITHFTSEPVLSVAISENGSCAISGTRENIFLFPFLKSTMELFVGGPVTCVSLSSDGNKAAAATSQRIYLSADDFTFSQDYDISSATSMQFLKDGSLVAGTKDGSLYFIGETVRQIGDSLGPITAIETGESVIMASTSTTLYVYSSSGIERARITMENIVDCDISSDGRFIAVVDTQNLHVLNDVGEELWKVPIDNAKSVEMSSDGKYITVAAEKEIFFSKNWENTFSGTHSYPYPSRELYSFDAFKKVWSYQVPHAFTPYSKQEQMGCAVGDVNGDGKKEIVIADGSKLAISDSGGRILDEKDAEGEILHIALLDVTSDSVPEILYTVNDGRYTVYVIDYKNETNTKFDFTQYFDVSTKEKREAAITPVISYDIDNDTLPEVIAVVNSGYTLIPRGIIAFEYPSGTVEWFYESAASLVIDAFCDIDKDGKPEIIVGSHACCNGSVVGDQDDCHVYLIVLDLEGKEVWRKEVGSGIQVVRSGVEDIDSDGDLEIVGTASYVNQIHGHLFVMDKDGETLVDRDFDSSLSPVGICDFDNDGMKGIVVTDSDGNVTMCNHELTVLKTSSIATYQPSEIEAITDMDGDGNKDIVVKVWDKSFRILNSSLEEEWKWESEDSTVPMALVTNVSGCGNDLVIVAERAVELYSFEGEENDLCAGFTSPHTELPPSASLDETPASVFDRYTWILAFFIGIAVFVFVSVIGELTGKFRISELLHSTMRNRNDDLMILSLERRSETNYQVSLESVQGEIHPAKSSRAIEISPQMRSEIIKRIDYTSKVINTFLLQGKKPEKTAEELKRMGTVLYRNFIPQDFAQQLVYHYLVLEVEDVQIPWELMYSEEFLALEYAISRRIKSEKVLPLRKQRKRRKKALIIADPTGTLPEAVRESEYLADCLQGYFTVTYLRPEKARKVDVMYHFSQGYDIIHYAGELGESTCLPVNEDVMTCAEIERTLEGSPVVFLNGCGSARAFSHNIEGLAKVFLEKGALSFIGSLWSIHDRTAAEIAEEFYRNCLHYPVGEALRLARAKNYSSGDITWAAFVMYGDPTLNLYK